jgi:Fe-S oxidoreductase
MKRREATSGDSRKDRLAVILFPDSITVYNEPNIGRAAVLTLELLGYRVVLPKIGCCGRSLISTGMLAEAQGICRDTASALSGCIAEEKAVAVVGCEPSCISAIKDDWLDLDLGLDQSMLRNLDAQAFLVEQFVDARWDEHPARPAIAGDGGPFEESVLLHAHCHQKALWGADTSANALKRVLGNRLRVLDSGCCGMAGSFGYAREHYDLSMIIGEQSLFGPLRESPEAIVVAPGTSCRQQIHDGLGRIALHPIELIAQQLGIDVRS